MAESFTAVYERLEPEIKAVARNRKGLHWMATAEVYNWLLFELWMACETFDPSKGDRHLTIEKYWWKCWLNRRSKLNRQWYTLKTEANKYPYDFTASEALTSDVPTGIGSVTLVSALRKLLLRPPEVPLCPVGGLLESRVWRLLANGCTVKDAMQLLGLRQSVMSDIMDSFRSEAVYQLLKHS